MVISTVTPNTLWNFSIKTQLEIFFRISINKEYINIHLIFYSYFNKLYNNIRNEL
jgi:hypothetical protein